MRATVDFRVLNPEETSGRVVWMECDQCGPFSVVLPEMSQQYVEALALEHLQEHRRKRLQAPM